MYLFLAVLGLLCCAGFSLVAEAGGHSFVAVWQASRCCGFSCCKAQALGHTGVSNCHSVGSTVAAPRL